MSSGDSWPDTWCGAVVVAPECELDGSRRTTSQMIAAIRMTQNSPMKIHAPPPMPPPYQPIMSVSFTRVRDFGMPPASRSDTRKPPRNDEVPAKITRHSGAIVTMSTRCRATGRRRGGLTSLLHDSPRSHAPERADAASVWVAVAGVGVVLVGVRDRGVGVLVGVPGPCRHGLGVLVLVLGVVGVPVVMGDRVVGVLVRVALGEVQPDSDGHEDSRRDEGPRDAVAERNRQECAEERSDGEVGAGAGRADAAQRDDEENEA